MNTPPTLREDIMDMLGRYTERHNLQAVDAANHRDYNAAITHKNHAEAAQNIALLLNGTLQDHKC